MSPKKSPLGWNEVEVVKDDKHFHLEIGPGGDSIQVNVKDNGNFDLEIEEPWAGSTETGFGALCSLTIDAGKMKELCEWAMERIKARGTP